MSVEREQQLAVALAEVRARLAGAAAAAGRAVDEIELLAVTKFFPADDVVALHRLGCHAFGESRDQEASRKVAEVAALIGSADIRWHMVGRIQRNKARSVAQWAHVAHSVDSLKLVHALDRAAAEALDHGLRTVPLDVFAQVSLDGDESRGGVDVDATARIDELCAAMEQAPGLRFAGLMAIPPIGADPDSAFARLQQEHQRVQSKYPQRLELSAGMSGDLEAAVKHGSTCVRVGTALLGSRPLTSPAVTPVTRSPQTTESLGSTDKTESSSPHKG
ncbi:YggS family pyridoxal phosphate-dependent enzyme [Mycolicibacterium duvalii]|uniref:Pyridoxal phosphate homeostasis protein n=1 Tax=Mycolicibacterium duvalii TaxID=39688 RepID=A0A7I7JXL3_9MYCO|nr:YggS family pyridoxal phosphate-dependent enzyme [Mycolicibacterium duvalii]MCV7369336.1 YggS family pyridoxal phosphate-dependent enzyme [Mycolicibacterium duvalii]PEG40603.1 YggS family pyridoxal phosphate-dependent enzyme [Mycolicibacterium duvalii]BBX16054.1 YggS family pyridoxal phosphate enzyme [Mycolicibacterium duvalii]